MLKKSKTPQVISFARKRRTVIYLIFILVGAFYFRTFNINWDSNYYFHPDERAIVMFTIPLALPSSLSEFFSPTSPLNPHFFAYGNFPLYLLKIASLAAGFINPLFNSYGNIHFVARFISAVFDTGTVFLIFLLGTKLFSKRTGLFASLVYAVSVYPVQLSHYFAVDTLLTFFMISTLFFSMLFIEKTTIKRSIILGIFFGFSLATKISALILVPFLFFVFFFAWKKVHKKNKLLHTGLLFATFAFSTILIFVITQPYALIDIKEYISQTKLQSQMSQDPFIFPYTLQYVGKIPYIHELKNIFLFGMGPIIATLAFFGCLVFTISVFRKKMSKRILMFFVLLYFYSYFVVFGKFSVGWMRYMPPIYPLLAFFGGYLISEVIINKIPKKYLSHYVAKKILLLLLLLSLSIYIASYLAIYKQPNTRIQASDWINKNIPPGNTIAIEHWDDGLPVFGHQNYTQFTLPLYEPDTISKWEQIHSTLESTEYIIIASNRLYVPLQKLTNCKDLPPGRCYTITANYYKNLFSEKLGFRKVAQFYSYPTLPFTNIRMVDDSADESFTVIDHPKILIFKKD